MMMTHEPYEIVNESDATNPRVRLWRGAAAIGVASGLAMFGLSGCNTVEGVGEDVEAAGEAIDDTADDASE